MICDAAQISGCAQWVEIRRYVQSGNVSVADQSSKGRISKVPAATPVALQRPNITGDSDMGVRSSRSYVPRSQGVTLIRQSHQDAIAQQQLRQQWQSLTDRQPHDAQLRSHRFAPPASVPPPSGQGSPSEGASSSSIITHFGVGRSRCANYSDTDRYIVDHYPPIVGSCIYIPIACRPDIAFAVGKCARGMHNPLPKHVAMLRHLVRYLRKTKDCKLLYCRNGNASDE